MIKCDALRDLLPLVQFKKREKTPIEECSACIFTKSNSPPLVFFHVFLIVQMVPNRAKHHK